MYATINKDKSVTLHCGHDQIQMSYNEAKNLNIPLVALTATGHQIPLHYA